MTFDEWKEAEFFPEDRGMITPEMAWKAATKAEREACAKLCEAATPIHERFDDQRAAGNMARKCATAIRMRSNVK